MYPFRVLLLGLLYLLFAWIAQADEKTPLNWQRLPDLPDALGVAGPLVGVHKDVLIVAGGANFEHPVWESTKIWRDSIYVLENRSDHHVWLNAGKLPRPLGYGASVSTNSGVVCIGGNSETQTYSDCFRLSWDSEQRRVQFTKLPSLPVPSVYGHAALIDNKIYLISGQTGTSLDTATKHHWMLDLSLEAEVTQFCWKSLSPTPGPPRAFAMCVSIGTALHLMGGRYQGENQVVFLNDHWQYDVNNGQWKERSSLPKPISAGVAIASDSRRILVLGGDDGQLFLKTDELKDRHPGFPKDCFAYDAETDRWSHAGQSPQNQLTTTAVKWNEAIIIPSGEIRPRVRTPAVWRIK